MITNILVYFYYIYRTYILYYYHYFIYKLYNDYREYYIIVISQNKKECHQFPLDSHSYTFLNSKIFTSFILVKHNIYINKEYLTYYEIITDKMDIYKDFMEKYITKPLEISKCKFVGAEIKTQNKVYAIPIEQFMVTSNLLFFKEFNMWLLKYYFKSNEMPSSVSLIDTNINIINLTNEHLCITENDYVKTI